MSFDERVRDLPVGRSEARTRTFTAGEILDHQQLTGDAPTAPGLVPIGMLGGMVSELLGTRLPGRGTNWLKQKLVFVGEARVDEALTTTIEITRVRPDKALINLASVCTGSDGRVICRGESLVLVRELELIG